MTEHEIKTESGEGARLFCDLSALDVAERERRSLLGRLLQVGTLDVVELPDGFAFHVDPVSMIAQHLEEFAALERRCCPFLTVAVRAATGDVPPVMEIGGNAVKEFIAAQFGIRKRPTP